MEITRGLIRNREFAAQIRDFSGLRFGSITPTDMDGYIEYHNVAWVLFELKYGDALLPFGQQLAFERHCVDLNKVKPTLGIIARHDAKPPEDIYVAGATVASYWSRGMWRKPSGCLTVRRLVGLFLAKVDTGYFYVDKTG